MFPYMSNVRLTRSPAWGDTIKTLSGVLPTVLEGPPSTKSTFPKAEQCHGQVELACLVLVSSGIDLCDLNHDLTHLNFLVSIPKMTIVITAFSQDYQKIK